MASIKHFRDLSLENKLRTYTALSNGDAKISEKKDGVFIGFRFAVPTNSYMIPQFPPILEIKSYNSPWVGSGREYVNWAGHAKFSSFFGTVIDCIQGNEKLKNQILAEMVASGREIISAELFSAGVSEYDPYTERYKMIRTWYDVESFEDVGLSLFFHDAKTLPTVKKFPLFQMFATELDQLITDKTLEEILSRKAENREFRAKIDELVTEKVENLALKAYVIPEELEGVVIEAYETISKVVHPDFMSWPLNKVLFEGDA